ncbi:MAG: hypothetical protein MUF23_04500 [Pirellula sp.]|jgi:hypothetical protein|nr:hypothetical protein [Pirellula sp.]
MITDPILLAYLEESLSSEVMSKIENELRQDASLRNRLSDLIAQRESGVHSIGDIWRRNRLSCPSREELGSYLLGAMMDDAASYVKFHLDQIGCRYCQANLEDLKAANESSGPNTNSRQRRERFFQSSVGRVRKFPER